MGRRGEAVLSRRKGACVLRTEVKDKTDARTREAT